MMTERRCPVCNTTMDVEWIDVRSYGDSTPSYLPGQITCPHRCDPRIAQLLTRNDGPVFDADGQCVSLGLGEEIRRITGDRTATLRSVIDDTDMDRRRRLLYEIGQVAAWLGLYDRVTS